MMKLSSPPFTAAVLMAISACATSGAPGDDSGEVTGSVEQPEPGCTPATDSVPIADMIAGIDLGGYVGSDMARGPDGTVYFIQEHRSATTTLARRLPCHPVEYNWFVTEKGIHDIEVSSDNVLYAAADGPFINTSTAELLRFDPSDATPNPKVILSTAGQKIGNLSAGPNGRVFFTRYSYTQSFLGYIQNGVAKIPWTLGWAYARIAAMPDGSAMFIRNSDAARFVGTFKINANGSATVTEVPIPADSDIDFRGNDIRGDANGGVYIIRMDSTGDGWTCMLEHASDLLSPHTLVAKVENTGGCSTSFAVDGDPMSATMVVTGTQIVAGNVSPVTAVTLPVAAVLP